MCLVSKVRGIIRFANHTLFRYYREGDEKAVQYPIGEGDTALEQIYEQHL